MVRVESPVRLNIDQGLEVKANSLVLQDSVSRGEDTNEQIEEQYHIDDEVESEKDNSLDSLWFHVVVVEFAKHPAEERYDGASESEERRNHEADDPY